MKIKLQFQKSGILLKVAVLAVVVLCTLAMLSMRSVILRQREEKAQLQKQAQVLEQENNRLESGIAVLGTVQGVIQIAQNELGLVLPDTVVLTPEQ